MGKWLCLAAIALVFSSPVARTDSLAPESRPRTCLVLGGGGARGAAHIGVLKILERERVPIDCIVGTSMGAIVGGLYATGYSADEIERVLKGINWSEVFKDDPIRGERPVRRKEDELRFVGGVEVGLDAGGIALPRGFVQGQQLLLLLRRLFQSTWQVEHFDRLPIPFRSVAADIVSGEKVVFSEGDLATAIRASMSVPGAFAPMRVNGRLLVDGGMVDNVPIDEARAMGAERLIVVAVGANLLKEDELTSPFAIADQMLTALMQNRSRAQIATLGPGDLFIEPELGNFGSARFDLAADAIKIGVAAGEAATPKLRAFAADETSYARWQSQHDISSAPAPRVDFVRSNGLNERANTYVTHRFEKQVGKPFDAKALEKDIAVMYGEGRHESVSWRLTREEARTGVAIDAVEKPWGPNFLRFGIELSDNFNGRSAYQALVQARFTKMNDRGGEGMARLQLGRLLNARAEFYQPWGWDGQFSLSPYLQYRAFNFPLRLDPSDESFFAELHRSEFVGGAEVAWNPNSHWRLSAGLERGREEARFQIGDPKEPPATGNVSLARGRLQYDTLDSVTFPTTGLRLDLSTEVYSDNLGSRESADVTRLAFDGAFGGGRDHVLLGLQLASSHGGDNTIGVVSKLGGLANLSGYLADEVLGNQVALARVIYYRKISSDSQILGLPLFAGASLERGGFWNHRDDVDSDDLISAGSLFLGADTILGPIFFGYGSADTGVDSFYLRIGTLLRSDLRL